MKKEKIILFAIMLMAVGFASVTTTLILNGTLNFAVSDDFDVIFTSAKLNGVEHDELITNDKKTINFITNELIKISDEETLTYKVANRSKNYDANVSISCESINNEYVDITLPSETRVLAGEERTGSIIVRLIKASESDKEINLTCTLNAEAIERDTLGDDTQEPVVKSRTLRAVSNNDTNDFWQYKENITRVVFEQRMSDIHISRAKYIYDVSENKDGSVMSYVVPNIDDSETYTVYIQSQASIKANKNSSNLFSGFTNLSTIEGLEYFDTSSATNMGLMFSSCRSLIALDLSSFDTSGVDWMVAMFSGCENIAILDLSSFNTNQVINMKDMFNGCKMLTTLNVNSFDTSQVTNMNAMFHYCQSLTTLDVSNFNTSSVTDMGAMFNYCQSLTSLDVSNFNTSSVTNMGSMFNNCKSLAELDVSNFNTSQVLDMSSVFCECESLTNLDLSGFDTSSTTNMSFMLAGCGNLSATITIKGSAIQNYGNIFIYAARKNNAQIVVNYTNDTSSLVDAMIATKSDNSNVVKGNLVA